MAGWADPPPGYVDCLFDAGRIPAPDDAFAVVEVDDLVGVVQARAPLACSVALLGAASQPRIDAAQRVKHITGFLQLHLAAGEWERLLLGMADGTLPADTVRRVHRAICIEGTGRPFRAVASLAGTAAASWRNVRAHLVGDGIPDPMVALPHLHALLDVVESLLLEQAVKQEDRDRLIDALYRPELAAVTRTDGTFTPPPGFDAAAMEDGFDALMAQS